MLEVVFTEDFATKKKGDVFQCDSLLASHLVNIDKVAKYKDDVEKQQTKVKKESKIK